MSMMKEPQTDGKGSYYPRLCLLVALVTAVTGLGLPLYVLGWSREHGMTIGQYVDPLHPSTELTRAVTSAQFKTALLISVSAALPMGFETLVDCAYTMVYEEERLLWYSKTLLLLAVTIPNLVLLLGNFGVFSDDAYLLATSCTRVSIAGFTMAYASQIFHKYHMKDLSRRCLLVTIFGSLSYLIRTYSNFASPAYLASTLYFSTALRLVAHALFVDIIRLWYQMVHSSQEALAYCEMVIVFKVLTTFIANSIYSLVALYFNASNDRDASSDCICMYMYVQIIYTVFVMSILGHISRLEVGYLSRDMKERQAFIRYISHEIRTPLNTVFLGLEYVTSALKEIPSRKWDTSMEPIIDTVTDIYCSCEIALSILNDLLTFDKMEGGKMTLDLEFVNCHSFMSALLKPFNVNARNKNIHFQLRNSNLSMDFIRNAHINIDECKMGQVVRNLISNALKFTPDGGTVTVTMLHVQANNPFDSHNQSKSDSLPSLWPFINNLTAASKLPSLRDMLRVEVQDTGAGISHFNQTKLFGQYVQFNANKLQKGSGSGLGLWISKGITELHGGSIGGHSDGEERGSTFFIELPVTFLIDDDEELAASNSGGCSVSTPSTPSIDHIRRTRCDAKRMQQYTNDFKGLMPQNEIGNSMSRMTAESLTEGVTSHIKRAGDSDLSASYSSAIRGLSKTSLRVPSGGDSTLESGFPFLPSKLDRLRGSSDAQSAAEDEGGISEKGETDDLLGEARKIQSLRREISLISGASSVSSCSSQKTESASASASLFGLSEMLTRSIKGGISESSTSRKDSPDFLSSAHPFMVTSMPNIHSISSSRNSSSKYHSRFTSMSNSPLLGNSGSSTPVTISTGLSTPYLHSPHSSPRGSGTHIRPHYSPPLYYITLYNTAVYSILPYHQTSVTAHYDIISQTLFLTFNSIYIGTIPEPWIRNSASFPRSTSRHDNLESICEREPSLEGDSAFNDMLMRSSSSSLRPEKGERERSSRSLRYQIPECCLEELQADSPERSPGLPRLGHALGLSQRDLYGTKGEPSNPFSNASVGGGGGGGGGSVGVGGGPGPTTFSSKDPGKDLAGMESPLTQPLHFLIVDDAPLNRRMVHRLLSIYNFEISEAKDGKDCLRVLDEVQTRGGKVDVVLMDNSMPVMTGEWTHWPCETDSLIDK